MKRISLYKKPALLMMVFLLTFTTGVMAQPDGNGEDPPPNDIPIDGGLSLLLAAGVGYGIKKVRDSRRQEKENAS